MRSHLFLPAVLLMLCTVAGAALAQQGPPSGTEFALGEVGYAIPDAPHAAKASTSSVAPLSFSEVIALPRTGSAAEVQPPASLLAAPPAARKVFDRKFIALAVATLALTAMDVEMTQHCIRARTCYEMNPTLPSSRWGQYAENSATNLAVFYFSYRRRKSGKWGWWLPPVVDIGAHVVGVGSNIRFLK